MSMLDILNAAETNNERMTTLYKQDRAAFHRYLHAEPASFEAPRMEWLVLRNLNQALLSQLDSYSRMAINLVAQ